MRKQVWCILLSAVLVIGMMTGCGAKKENSDSHVAKAEKSKEIKEKEQSKSDKKKNADEEVYEVSREDFDDCDGSGHGYTEIHYSDGRVEIEEY